MDDLFNLLTDSGIGCYIGNVCVNDVFYADDLCLIAPYVTALQQLLNICHSYSANVDLNLNALKSFCFAYSPKRYTLSLPLSYFLIPHLFLMFNSVNYLGFTFTRAHKDDDDDDMLRQMPTLYARSRRLLRIVHGCSNKVPVELARSLCGSFYCSYLAIDGHIIILISLLYLSCVFPTTTYIARYYICPTFS